MLFAALLIIFLLLPDLYPHCSCCGKKKFRGSFKIHEAIGFRLGYGSSRSICKKCSLKYAIADLEGYYRYDHIRRKVIIDLDKAREKKELTNSYVKMKKRKSTHF
jgi:hypothetical protein